MFVSGTCQQPCVNHDVFFSYFSNNTVLRECTLCCRAPRAVVNDLRVVVLMDARRSRRTLRVPRAHIAADAKGKEIDSQLAATRDDKQLLTARRVRQPKDRWEGGLLDETDAKKPREREDTLVDGHPSNGNNLNRITANSHDVPFDDSQVQVPVEADPLEDLRGDRRLKEIC